MHWKKNQKKKERNREESEGIEFKNKTQKKK